MQKHTKICFIIPEYNINTSDHFYHHYELLEKLKENFDIFLMSEKSQKFKFLPLRFLESLFLVLKARIKGCKIFYTHYCYIGAINAAIISRLSGGKSYYWNCAMNWLFKQRTLQGLSYKLSMKLSHYLVTGSEEMKRGYSEHYDLSLDKIKVVPNWINLERFRATNSTKRSDQPSTKVILFVHWLSKRKGADMIIPIMKHFNQAKRSTKRSDQPSEAIKLMVVGEGPYKNKLIDEIKENKLEKKIKLLGSIPNKEIVNYYSRADVLIMPSMEEGFPRILLEAMAMGVPYVAFDVGAAKEMSPKIAQRFLVKPGDIEKFIHKLEILLTDKKIYEQFRKEEIERIKKYSLEKVAEKFIELFS